jgi:hypothetical protein
VPAAAVIPAPIAYIKVVAVKKLVVEFRARCTGPLKGVLLVAASLTFWLAGVPLIGCVSDPGLLP